MFRVSPVCKEYVGWILWLTWWSRDMFRMGAKGISSPLVDENVNQSVHGVVMMSCSVRKNGPKCSSKYCFSCLARLWGADHRSTGSVVMRMYLRPKLQITTSTILTEMTSRGWRTQNEPQQLKTRRRKFSKRSPRDSQHVTSPGRK